MLIIFEPGGEMKIQKGFTFIEKTETVLDPKDLDTSKVKK